MHKFKTTSSDVKSSLTGKYLMCNNAWEAHHIDHPNTEVFSFIEGYMKGYDDAKYLYELGDIDLDNDPSDNNNLEQS